MKMKRAMHGCAAVHLGTKTYGIVSGGYYKNYCRNELSSTEMQMIGLDQNSHCRNELSSTEMIDLDQNSPAWIEGMSERWKNSFALDN